MYGPRVLQRILLIPASSIWEPRFALWATFTQNTHLTVHRLNCERSREGTLATLLLLLRLLFFSPRTSTVWGRVTSSPMEFRTGSPRQQRMSRRFAVTSAETRTAGRTEPSCRIHGDTPEAVLAKTTSQGGGHPRPHRIAATAKGSLSPRGGCESSGKDVETAGVSGKSRGQ